MTSPAIPCLICGDPLSFRLARGRKSNKPFVMVICPRDGRHFRGFVTDKAYVSGVLDKLEGCASSATSDGDASDPVSNGGHTA